MCFENTHQEIARIKDRKGALVKVGEEGKRSGRQREWKEKKEWKEGGGRKGDTELIWGAMNLIRLYLSWILAAVDTEKALVWKDVGSSLVPQKARDSP